MCNQIKLNLIAVLALALLLGMPAPPRAAHDGQPAQQYPWETVCRHPLPADGPFTAQERWAWDERLCIGKPANLREFAAKDARSCDPEKIAEWLEAQTLSPTFLMTVLFTQPFKSALPSPKLQITCAWVKDDIDLSNNTLSQEFWFDRSRFDGSVDLTALRVEQSLTFDGAEFKQLIHGRNMSIEVDLRMRNAKIAAMQLDGAKLDGSLVMSGAVIADGLSGRSLQVAHALLLDEGAKIQSIDLTNASIGRQLSFSGSTVEHRLVADDIVLRGDLVMNAEAQFSAVALLDSVITGSMQIDTATVTNRFDLTNAKIAGELTLNIGDEPDGDVAWEDQAALVLQNTKIGALNDSRTAWFYKDRPGKFIPLDLKGFAYETLGGLGEGDAESMAQRDVEWMLEWLSAQTNTANLYTPQPYQQLAKVVGELGFVSKREEILYAMRDSERTSDNISAERQIWLTLQWLVIGYGYDNIRSLIPFGLLVVFGAWLGRYAETTRALSPAKRFWFSLDRALPFVELGLANEVEAPKNWVGSYYYVQAILGFILASFLFAGLTGFAE